MSSSFLQTKRLSRCSKAAARRVRSDLHLGREADGPVSVETDERRRVVEDRSAREKYIISARPEIQETDHVHRLVAEVHEVDRPAAELGADWV